MLPETSIRQGVLSSTITGSILLQEPYWVLRARGSVSLVPPAHSPQRGLGVGTEKPRPDFQQRHWAPEICCASGEVVDPRRKDLESGRLQASGIGEASALELSTSSEGSQGKVFGDFREMRGCGRGRANESS